jgi:hypothetical protein
MWAFRQTILAGLTLSLVAGSVVMGAGAGYEFRELSSLEAGVPDVDCPNCTEDDRIRRAEELVCDDEESEKCKNFREHVKKTSHDSREDRDSDDGDFFSKNWGIKDLLQTGLKLGVGEYQRRRQKDEDRRMDRVRDHQIREVYLQNAAANNFQIPGANAPLLDYSRTSNGLGRGRGAWDGGNGPGLDMRIQSGRSSGGLPSPGASVLNNPGGGFGRGAGGGGVPNIQ